MHFLRLLEDILNKRRIVDVGDTEVFINPTQADMAALLAKHGQLRALSSRGYFVVWAAEKLHEPVRRAIDFDIRARRFIIYGHTERSNSQHPLQIGRFAAAIWTDQHKQLRPIEYSPEMRIAFGL